MHRAIAWLTVTAAFVAAGAWADEPVPKGEVKVSAKADAPKPGAKDAGQKPAPARVQAYRRSGGWLGIRMGAMPEGLAAHLKLKKDAGVIVRNVVVGSPADLAGLERYDVILQVDGKGVDLGTLGGKINQRKPAEKVTLDIVHQGRKRSLQIVLAKRAPLALAKMKYEEQPQTIWQDRMKLQGNLWRKGPEGWRPFRGKGPMADVEELLKSVPKFGEWQMEVELDAGGDGIASWTMRRTRNSKTTEIQRHKDGRITVRKSQADKDGATNAVSKTYKNAEALRKADPEAHKMYERTKTPSTHPWLMPRFRFDQRRWDRFQEWLKKDTDRYYEELKKELERQRQQSRRWADEYKKWAEEWRKQMESAMKTVPAPMQPSLRELNERMKHAFDWGAFGRRTPLREFKVDSDGSIEVRIRQRGDDLTLKFKNETDFKAKRPKLHEQYQKLLKSVK